MQQTAVLSLKIQTLPSIWIKSWKPKTRLSIHSVGGVAGLLCSHDVDVHKGIGTITKDKNVLVNGELLETKKIILAGGSKVSKINVPGMESPLC